jgi:hypothetical protein
VTDWKTPYYPRARFYRNEVIHPAFDYEIYTNELVALARARGVRARGGRRDTNTIFQSVHQYADLGGLIWVGIDEKALDAEGSFDYENIKPPALICDYTVEWKNTRAGRDWFYAPSAKEEEYRALARAQYENELDELLGKENKDEEDVAEIETLENLLSQIADGGAGYLETSFNWSGSGTEGIFWGLGVANVPVTVFGVLPIEGGVALRLKRLEPPKGQADHDFEIALGREYSLIIGSDGNSADFVHYRLDADDAEALRGELEEIKDRGRLTPDDQQIILGWHLDIQKIRNDAKKRDGGDKALTTSESASIKALEQRIEDLKESKRGLTAADAERKREIEDELIIARMQFVLQEASRSLLNVPVDITFIPLESGHVVIHVGDERRIYENKEWQKDKPDDVSYRPHSLSGNIQLHSDGGKWGVLYGEVFHTPGKARTPAFPIPFAFDEDELRFSINGLAPEGTTLSAQLVEVQAPKVWGGVPADGLYQIVVTLEGDRRTPEFYGVELYIAAVVDEEETEHWNSQIQAANPAANSGNHIVDVTMQATKKRGRLSKLHVHNADNVSRLLIPLAGLAADVELMDTTTMETTVIQKGGYIPTNAHPAISDLSDNGGYLQAAASIGDLVEVEIGGASGFLNSEIEARFSCDGVRVNDALRSLARDGGLPLSRYVGIPSEITDDLAQIKPSHVGKPFRIKPSAGTKYWEWMQQLVKDHAPRWELWENEDGIHLTRKAFRVRPDLAYSTTAPPNSKLRLRRKAGQAGGIVLMQDTREYYTSATFYGDKDPLTGQPFEATESIPQATDPRFENSMFYTGTPNHYTASQNEALKSDAACRLAAREFLNITPLTPQGLLPWTAQITVDYDPSVREGDLVTINAIKFLTEDIVFAALNAGDGPQMELSVRLAEDKRMQIIEVL